MPTVTPHALPDTHMAEGVTLELGFRFPVTLFLLASAGGSWDYNFRFPPALQS